MSESLKEIANRINQKSKDYKIGKLQDLRKDLKGLKKKANSNIFVDDSKTMTKDWAFHYGGRSEIQFNIGFEEEGFRYGMAFSLETSQTLPDINLLKPKMKKLNILFDEKPELFSDYKMWYWQNGHRSEIFDFRQISSDLIQKKTFIFFGKLAEEDKLDYNEILQTFDNMLPIYKYVQTGTAESFTQNTKTGANAPTTKYFSYWVEGQRSVEPLHAKLQALFVDYLSKKGINFKENKDYIDVQYPQGNEIYFCEIKPTQNLDSKYAIRIAIGQLLEYQYLNNKNAKLEIVIGSKPSDIEVKFVKSLNMKLTYFDELTNEFTTV
jgi:hypothetical protein